MQAAASKKNKKEGSASSTQGATDENAINSPSATDSQTSSSSQTASTVGAADCDSDLDDLKDNYSSLWSISAEMRETVPPESQSDERAFFEQEWDFEAGRRGTHWPLARLMFPIKNMVKQMATLLQCYCFETIATCQVPEQQNPYVDRMARYLGQLMAMRLAEIVTELLQSVLHPLAIGLVDESNAPLLTQKFWVQAIYTELLHASGRFRAVREREQKRPPNGLVKVGLDAYFESMIGTNSWVDSMFVWFPAAWMPLVVEAIRLKTNWWVSGGRHQGAVAFTDGIHTRIPGLQLKAKEVAGWQRWTKSCPSCPI